MLLGYYFLYGANFHIRGLLLEIERDKSRSEVGQWWLIIVFIYRFASPVNEIKNLSCFPQLRSILPKGNIFNKECSMLER